MNLLEFIVVSTIMLGIDITFLTLTFKSVWSDMIKNIQLSELSTNLNYMIIPYLIITLSIIIFVFPKINEKTLVKDSLLYGGLMGLFLYGLFDFTNLIIFKKYELSIAIFDTIWGGVLLAISTLLSKKVLIFLKDLI